MYIGKKGKSKCPLCFSNSKFCSIEAMSSSFSLSERAVRSALIWKIPLGVVVEEEVGEEVVDNSQKGLFVFGFLGQETAMWSLFLQ